MRSMGLVAESHRRAADAVLAPALVAWARHWCLLDDHSGAVVVAPAAVVLAAELGDVSWHAAGGAVCVVCNAPDWRLAVLGRAAARLPDDDLARDLLEAARSALEEAIVPALGLAATVVIPEPHPAAELLCLVMTVNGVDIAVVAAPAALDGHAFPGRRSAAVPLARRNDLLPQGSVRLKVEVSLLSAPARELLNLRAGDIVFGEKGLDTPFDVYADDNRLPLAAVLGSSGDRKAVRLKAWE